MKIYLFDKNTKEYIGQEEASSNPEETRIKGTFIPLLPPNATLIEPPEFSDNTIPVFDGESWSVVTDYRKNFSKADDKLEISEITSLGEQEGYYVVEKSLGECIRKRPYDYKIQGGKVVMKSEEELNTEAYNKRKTKFENEYFQTSQGWVKRDVILPNGDIKDFVSDILLQIKASLELGAQIEVTFYKTPDFAKPIENIEDLKEKHAVDMDFVNECLAVNLGKIEL